MTTGDIPSLVGYRPEEAEKAIVESGYNFCWIDSEKPKWLSPCHEARVGRQRLREDGAVELLRVYIPILRVGAEITSHSLQAFSPSAFVVPTKEYSRPGEEIVDGSE